MWGVKRTDLYLQRVLRETNARIFWLKKKNNNKPRVTREEKIEKKKNETWRFPSIKKERKNSSAAAATVHDGSLTRRRRRRQRQRYKLASSKLKNRRMTSHPVIYQHTPRIRFTTGKGGLAARYFPDTNWPLLRHELLKTASSHAAAVP